MAGTTLRQASIFLALAIANAAACARAQSPWRQPVATPGGEAPHVAASGTAASLAQGSSDTRGIIVLGAEPERRCTLIFGRPFQGSMGQPVCTFTPLGAPVLVLQVAADASRVEIALAPPQGGKRISYICLE